MDTESCPLCGDKVGEDDAYDISERMDNDRARCPACGLRFGGDPYEPTQEG
ncbi:hypothetical protein ACFOGJ_16295 [Marinibaculum pumilum]|uniref:Small CPxCG-related zinc finger protein n=1 Tax=Marinibaculum pumilum TaxID=1766165 RepID=A0ABV7L2C7_9PROT